MQLSSKQHGVHTPWTASRQLGHRHNHVVNSRRAAELPLRAVADAVASREDTSLVRDEQDVSELLESTYLLTLKDRAMATEAFQAFQRSIGNKPALQSDWLSFTSRPWVQGPVDAILGNTHLAAMTSQHKQLAAAVATLVETLDTVLVQGGHVPWLLHVVQHVADHSGMYVIMQAVEEMLGPHHIARLERLTYAALTRPRAVKAMAVLVALLTPAVVEDLLQLAKAVLTDERLTRMMDAAEFVVTADDRMMLAALALDSLSDSVGDPAILHLIATLDSQADVVLLVRSGQELLDWVLADPQAMGAQLGAFVDAVTDMKRLERTVRRNDEVMTLERIAIMHKVLAQISPAGSPHNITAAVTALRSALEQHSLHTWLSAAGASVTAAELRAWWSAFDAALSARHVKALLDAVEALLDGGRVWALMGQPQPALEMLLIADEEARAATCRSRCGNHSNSSDHDGGADSGARRSAAGTAAKRSSSGNSSMVGTDRGLPGSWTSAGSEAASDRLPVSSRDEWTMQSLASMDDAGTASTSNDGFRGSLSTAAAAAAAAANAAAEAAAVAPACALDDKDCHDCDGRCGSPVERAFAGGAQLSDPDLAALIRASLRDIRPHMIARQRAAARNTAQQVVGAAAAAGGMADDGSPSSSILASFDVGGLLISGSPLSSLHLATEAIPTSSAQENAGAAAAAAIALSAAAAASQGGTCGLAAPGAFDLSLPSGAMADASTASKARPASPTGSSSSSSVASLNPEEHHARLAVSGAARLARAAFKPQRLRSFFDLGSELLAPQRLAISMAVLDNILRIGEHAMPVGPVCEINSAASVDAGSSSSSSGSRSWLAAVTSGALSLLVAVPSVVPQRLLDAAVAAAADTASTPQSRTQVLHAADTLLALVTVQQELQLLQQQQQQQQKATLGSQLYKPESGADAAGVRAEHSNGDRPAPLQQAAAVMHCALGDPHSCVTAEQMAVAAAAEGDASRASSSSSSSRVGKGELLATLVGLHVTLFRDMVQLWWAFHTRLALRLASPGRA